MDTSQNYIYGEIQISGSGSVPVDAPDIPLSIIFDILKALAFQKYST